jgi:hypothetical protein
MSEATAIESALAGIERLQAAYFLERMVFLAGGVIALALLTAITIMMIVTRDVAAVNWIPLFGSGGLFMVTGSGTMLYFNKSFDLLRELAKVEASGE